MERFNQIRQADYGGLLHFQERGGKKEPRDRPSQGWERDLGLCAGFGQQARQETGRKKGTSDTVLTAGLRREQKQKRTEVSSRGAWKEGGEPFYHFPFS